MNSSAQDTRWRDSEAALFFPAVGSISFLLGTEPAVCAKEGNKIKNQLGLVLITKVWHRGGESF